MKQSAVKGKVIGLTGGIGAGKSAVAKIIQSKGIPVLSADTIARQILQPGSLALREIGQLIGPELILSDGSLNRSALRSRISSDQEIRKTLDTITHPKIQASARAQIDEHLNSGTPLVVYEAPLLFEANSDRHMDAVICVTAPDQLRIKRIMARDGGSESDAKKILSAQMPQSEKIKKSDFILENDGDIDQLEQKTIALLNKILLVPTS